MSVRQPGGAVDVSRNDAVHDGAPLVVRRRPERTTQSADDS
jgi:hypothetical protein